MDPAVRGRGGLGAALRGVVVCVAAAAGVPALTSCGEPAHAQDDGALYKALIGQPVGLKLATGETVAGTLLGVDAAVFLVQLPDGQTKKVVRALVTDVTVGAAAGVPAAGPAVAAPVSSGMASAPAGAAAGRTDKTRHGVEIGNSIGYKLSIGVDKGALDAVAVRAGFHLLTLSSLTSPLGPGVTLGVQTEFGRGVTQFITGVEFNVPYASFDYFHANVLGGIQVDPDTPFEFEVGFSAQLPGLAYGRPHLSFGWVW